MNLSLAFQSSFRHSLTANEPPFARIISSDGITPSPSFKDSILTTILRTLPNSKSEKLGEE